MGVRRDSDFLGADARTTPKPAKAEEPTADCNSKGVEHRGLPGGVIADEQIEAWIEFECTVRKTVKILDHEMVNLHL